MQSSTLQRSTTPIDQLTCDYTNPTSIYVGDLDQKCDNITLEQVFKNRYSTVVGAKIIKDPLTRSSRGYGFVMFASPQEATQAIREMDKVQILSRKIKTGPSMLKSAMMMSQNPTPSVPPYQRYMTMPRDFQNQGHPHMLHQGHGMGIMPNGPNGAGTMPGYPIANNLGVTPSNETENPNGVLNGLGNAQVLPSGSNPVSSHLADNNVENKATLPNMVNADCTETQTGAETQAYPNNMQMYPGNQMGYRVNYSQFYNFNMINFPAMQQPGQQYPNDYHNSAVNNGTAGIETGEVNNTNGLGQYPPQAFGYPHMYYPGNPSGMDGVAREYSRNYNPMNNAVNANHNSAQVNSNMTGAENMYNTQQFQSQQNISSQSYLNKRPHDSVNFPHLPSSSLKSPLNNAKGTESNSSAYNQSNRNLVHNEEILSEENHNYCYKKSVTGLFDKGEDKDKEADKGKPNVEGSQLDWFSTPQNACNQFVIELFGL